MATLSNQEIEQLQQQLKEKKEEIKVIYNKLVEAGAVPLSDDILDVVGGGNPLPTLPEGFHENAPTAIHRA